ncbi:hypothetical protein [Moorena sp. SIO3H5]|uniref:hypothetical protein n=1 Tax=Moorena sp. SIO3H5 TaxID=2607834 RepID=UPI0013B913C4|nr:hypothetical protein [Moorena sp. SIO3H5]NEO74400.1 hypothetical protein [Moorena sp. SIO3H5]
MVNLLNKSRYANSYQRSAVSYSLLPTPYSLLPAPFAIDKLYSYISFCMTVDKSEMAILGWGVLLFYLFFHQL